MKILFLNSNIPNYVTDGLFHGLSSIPGITVVDIPKMNYMYIDAASRDLEKTGSKGNTLYKLLSEPTHIKGDRTFWQADIEQYDFIIFSDIFEQCDLFHAIYKTIHPKRRNTLCIVDGYDVAALFPYFNIFFNLRVRPWSFLYNINNIQYFKREYSDTGTLYGLAKERFRILNAISSALLKKPKGLCSITMSVPKEDIEIIPLQNKIKDFVDYNVDPDLRPLFPSRGTAELGKWQPAFNNQQEYFDDIRNSRFGITAKRAGWDCLRHYEYAAKGAILCFKHLQAKSTYCAPLGLNDTNCIPYSNKNDLVNKIRNKSIWELESIQESQYKWISEYTTSKVAQRFLDKMIASSKVNI